MRPPDRRPRRLVRWDRRYSITGRPPRHPAGRRGAAPERRPCAARSAAPYTAAVSALPGDNAPQAPRRLSVPVDGLRFAALLFMPAETPRGALLVCHGAGSRKENHAVMGEQAAARGLAAPVFDFRGHGESEGAMDPGGPHDVAAAGETLLRESGAPWLAGRSSRMGGFLMLLAAHAQPALFRSLVLLCPADPRSCSTDSTVSTGGSNPATPASPRRSTSTPPRCASFSRPQALWPRRAACRACCSRTRATTARSRSRTASASPQCWCRPPASSPWSQAATGAGALARCRVGDHRLDPGPRLKRRRAGAASTPSGNAGERTEDCGAQAPSNGVRRATRPPTRIATATVPAEIAAVRRQPSSRPITAMVATHGT